MSDEKAMIAKCREFLNGQKLTNKLSIDGKSITFKFEETMLELIPQHPIGRPVLLRGLFLNIKNPQEWNELWGKTISRYSLDEDYSEEFYLSLVGSPQYTGNSPIRVFIFFNFETEAELNAVMSQPETFKGMCMGLKRFTDYIVEINKKG